MIFNEQALDEFCKKFDVDLVIRAHEVSEYMAGYLILRRPWFVSFLADARWSRSVWEEAAVGDSVHVLGTCGTDGWSGQGGQRSGVLLQGNCMFTFYGKIRRWG